MFPKLIHLSATVFFITPPFTQLNTPYPGTAYLKGFLNTKGISSFQSDLGIEVMMAIFSKNGLNAIATIHPNPSTSQTTITFAQEHKQGTVRILNSLGKEVKLLNFSGKQLIIEKGELLPDTYFMELNTEQGKVVQKLIISNL